MTGAKKSFMGAEKYIEFFYFITYSDPRPYQQHCLQAVLRFGVISLFR